jgi:CheY-like chemotaxis protein
MTPTTVRPSERATHVNPRARRTQPGPDLAAHSIHVNRGAAKGVERDVAGSAAEYRVLVVDDDPVVRRLVRKALGSEGYTVRTAAHGDEALRHVAAGLPHVVLLDVQMPVMDGREFARCLKDADPRPPIVTMSAAPRRAADIGAAADLAKPFDLDDLLAVVASCCATARARRWRRPHPSRPAA